jgi:hypothetical protein
VRALGFIRTVELAQQTISVAVGCKPFFNAKAVVPLAAKNHNFWTKD